METVVAVIVIGLFVKILLAPPAASGGGGYRGRGSSSGLKLPQGGSGTSKPRHHWCYECGMMPVSRFGGLCCEGCRQGLEPYVRRPL